MALPVEGGKPELGSGAQSASGGRSTNDASPYEDAQRLLGVSLEGAVG